jgi:hypothetical protein
MRHQLLKDIDLELKAYLRIFYFILQMSWRKHSLDGFGKEEQCFTIMLTRMERNYVRILYWERQIFFHDVLQI